MAKPINVKVRNMESTRFGSVGRKVPNQFVITTSDGEYLQSYDSVIAFKPWKHTGIPFIMLDRKTWDYSTTTGKYRNQFLGDASKAETQKKIDDGTYQLADLNA